MLGVLTATRFTGKGPYTGVKLAYAADVTKLLQQAFPNEEYSHISQGEVVPATFPTKLAEIAERECDTVIRVLEKESNPEDVSPENAKRIARLGYLLQAAELAGGKPLKRHSYPHAKRQGTYGSLATLLDEENYIISEGFEDDIREVLKENNIPLHDVSTAFLYNQTHKEKILQIIESEFSKEKWVDAYSVVGRTGQGLNGSAGGLERLSKFARNTIQHPLHGKIRQRNAGIQVQFDSRKALREYAKAEFHPTKKAIKRPPHTTKKSLKIHRDKKGTDFHLLGTRIGTFQDLGEETRIRILSELPKYFPRFAQEKEGILERLEVTDNTVRIEKDKPGRFILGEIQDRGNIIWSSR